MPLLQRGQADQYGGQAEKSADHEKESQDLEHLRGQPASPAVQSASQKMVGNCFTHERQERESVSTQIQAPFSTGQKSQDLVIRRR